MSLSRQKATNTFLRVLNLNAIHTKQWHHQTVEVCQRHCWRHSSFSATSRHHPHVVGHRRTEHLCCFCCSSCSKIDTQQRGEEQWKEAVQQSPKTTILHRTDHRGVTLKKQNRDVKISKIYPQHFISIIKQRAVRMRAGGGNRRLQAQCILLRPKLFSFIDQSREQWRGSDFCIRCNICRYRIWLVLVMDLHLSGFFYPGLNLFWPW